MTRSFHVFSHNQPLLNLHSPFLSRTPRLPLPSHALIVLLHSSQHYTTVPRPACHLFQPPPTVGRPIPIHTPNTPLPSYSFASFSCSICCCLFSFFFSFLLIIIFSHLTPNFSFLINGCYRICTRWQQWSKLVFEKQYDEIFEFLSVLYSFKLGCKTLYSLLFIILMFQFVFAWIFI